VSNENSYVILLEADRPRIVDEVRGALAGAGISFRTDLQAGPRPGVFFSVPERRLEEARRAVLASVDDLMPSDLAAPAAVFPWGPVGIAGTLVLVHFLIVLRNSGSADAGRAVLEWGGLLKGKTLDEPWRLFTSLLLHVDLRHAFWNAVSLIVFAVPLLDDLRLLRTSLIYLASGVGGACAALAFARPGVLTVGSSGAVAGLFGAWVVLTWVRSRSEPLTRRARIRALGIAMLVLPSLLSPVTSTGQPVSVSSHLGGLATGMAIGALISTGMLRRRGAG
jgi:membrane associated rhomboid family serine protease